MIITLIEMDCPSSSETLDSRSSSNLTPKITMGISSISLSGSPSQVILEPNDIPPNSCIKPARKYALTRTLSYGDNFMFKKDFESEQKHDSELSAANEQFETSVISDASNCDVFYDSDYTLNMLKFNKSSLINQKCVTKSDIARYASKLPYMTSRTRTKSAEQSEDKSKDYFDDGTMELVRHSLFQLSSIEGMATGASPSSITFHSTVKARRISESGKVNLLLHWSPENMVPDTWIAENELCLNFDKTIPVSQLPHEALQLPGMNVFGSVGILSSPGKRKRK